MYCDAALLWVHTYLLYLPGFISDHKCSMLGNRAAGQWLCGTAAINLPVPQSVRAFIKTCLKLHRIVFAKPGNGTRKKPISWAVHLHPCRRTGKRKRALWWMTLSAQTRDCIFSCGMLASRKSLWDESCVKLIVLAVKRVCVNLCVSKLCPIPAFPCSISRPPVFPHMTSCHINH